MTPPQKGIQKLLQIEDKRTYTVGTHGTIKMQYGLATRLQNHTVKKAIVLH